MTGFFTNTEGAVSYADIDRWATDNGNHGHRAASVLGGFNETVSTNPATEDVQGFNHGQGVNPLVRLGNAKMANLPLFSPPPTTTVYRRHAREMGSEARRINWDEATYNTLFGVYLAHKSVFSSNSWGLTQAPPITYSEWSRMADYIVRDCVPEDGTPGVKNWPGRQGMFSVFAAGNSGWDGAANYIFDSVANPGLAKNVLTVGGSQDVYHAPNPEPPQCVPTPTPVMLCTCNPSAGCDSGDRMGTDASRMYLNSSKGSNAAYLTKR